MADFDAIVVGSGCAGPVAALELARAGRSVLVVERGTFAGAKNVSGGRLYTHALRAVLPDFAAEAPLERRVVRERISMLAPDANVTVDYTDDLLRTERAESYTVLRARFDPWLAGKAEELGVRVLDEDGFAALLEGGPAGVGDGADTGADTGAESDGQ